MVQRTYWLGLIERMWEQKSIVWLAGVRRAGKTVLCKGLPDTEYFDCELPRDRHLMEDPQSFLEGMDGRRIVLDEVHRLPNPSELLKIAADHYPSVRVICTGSSTLGASSKFADTLTGRKRTVMLMPMCQHDMADAQQLNLDRRLLRGGLPPFFLPSKIDERDFHEWMENFWARDIQGMFRLERKDSFQRFVELLFAQSGGIFEASGFATPCKVSHTTISTYLRILEATLLVHVIRPFSTRRQSEIVSAPKVYAFDTGFVCHYRGWTQLRPEDRGILWEHFVLNEILAQRQFRDLAYWRDKRGHEIDFVLASRRTPPLAIECKWSANGFEPGNLMVFRRGYPEGDNVVLAQDVERPFVRRYGDLRVRFENLRSFGDEISKWRLGPLFADPE